MKTLWLDCETTGLDPRKNAVVQVAMILEGPWGERTWQSNIAPHPEAVIEEEALKISGRDLDAIRDYPNHREVFAEFIGMLGECVDKYDRGDKFYLRGYNSSFDWDFIHTWARESGEKYLMSYMHWPPLCVAQAIANKHPNRWAGLKSRKLGALAAEFGVQVHGELHDALTDVEVTRQLWRKVCCA